jgi:hypothetical protein
MTMSQSAVKPAVKSIPDGMHSLTPHLICEGAAAAKVVMPLADMFWGDRYGALEDPFGHRWSVATHTRDLTEARIRQNMAQMGTQPGA